VWYGANSCATFRRDGSGVQDLKGGSSTTIDSFPWKAVSFAPGSESVAVPRMRGYSYPLVSVLDPAYQRRAELKAFQWGVRLKADGSVHTDSRGHYEFALRFADGSVQRNGWNPVTRAPSTELMSGDGNLITGEQAFNNVLRDHVNTPPSTGHFCTFREATSMQLEPRCVETPYTNGAVTGTRRLCYLAGMLNGAYSVTRSDGRALESGQFTSNRPSGGWTQYRDDGTRLVSGSFNTDGLQFGEWLHYDTSDRLSARVPFVGVVTPSGRGTYHRVLDGTLSSYSTAVRAVEITGRVLEGKRADWWKTYEQTTDAGTNGQRLYQEHQYDATTQQTTGSFCYGSGDCVPTTQSWLKTLRTYVWQACGVAYPYMREVRYNTNGSPAGTSCFRINGTSASFTTEAMTFCPSSCV
jgi:hypothetical protein